MQQSFMESIKKGDLFTKLSVLIMGIGCMARKQFAKGLFYLAAEALFIYYMVTSGASNIKKLISLGGNETEKVWNEALGVYEYTQGDNTLLMLLFGVVTVFIIIGFVILWKNNIVKSYQAQVLKQEGKHVPDLLDDWNALFDQNVQKLLLPLPVAGVIVFTILPIVFMICMAFTSYSKVDNCTMIFNWVGLANFKKILNFNDAIGGTFWSVLGWTIIWAIFATFSNYILGMILALVINRNGTRAKSFWRVIFMLSAAIPQFVSLLMMRVVFSDSGIINTILLSHHMISEPIPFWSDATLARVMVIVINIWIGVPFTMLQVTGILQNIPGELYEAARVDGAGPVMIFRKITLPYMLFITAPYLITTFAANINNFNVIFLLSGGNPTPVGSTAGKTDLLVTWLYKLTIDNQYYNLGAVIGIMSFVVLAVVSLITYHRTGSYKNEEGFR